VVGSAARGDRSLLERPHARRRLARVEDRRAAAGDRSDVTRGERRDPREVAEEVERGALGSEHLPRGALGQRDVGRGGAPLPLRGQTLEGSGADLPEGLLGDGVPEHDPLLLLDDPAARPRVGRHDRVGGQVARADVLGEGAPHEIAGLGIH
jgi:hypothetical protein